MLQRSSSSSVMGSANGVQTMLFGIFCIFQSSAFESPMDDILLAHLVLFSWLLSISSIVLIVVDVHT